MARAAVFQFAHAEVRLDAEHADVAAILRLEGLTRGVHCAHQRIERVQSIGVPAIEEQLMSDLVFQREALLELAGLRELLPKEFDAPVVGGESSDADVDGVGDLTETLSHLA